MQQQAEIVAILSALKALAIELQQAAAALDRRIQAIVKILPRS